MNNDRDLFLNQFKKLVKKEQESTTKLHTFSELLRRQPGESFTTHRIEHFITDHELETRTNLYPDSVFFTLDVPWTAYLEPRRTGPLVYDLMIKFVFPKALFQQSSRCTVRIECPKDYDWPIPVPIPVIRDLSIKYPSSMACLPDFVTESSLKVNKSDGTRFIYLTDSDFFMDTRISSLKTLSRHQDHIPTPAQCRGEDATPQAINYIKQHLAHSLLPKIKDTFLVMLGALLDLISEETMRLSTANSWNTMFEFICDNLAKWRLKDLKSDEEFLIKCGLIPHMIKLLKADYTEGSWSTVIPATIMNIVYLGWYNTGHDHFDEICGTSAVILDKIKDKRTGVRLYARLTINVLTENIITSFISSKMYLKVSESIHYSMEIFDAIVSKLSEYVIPQVLNNLALHMDLPHLYPQYRFGHDADNAFRRTVMCFHLLAVQFLLDEDTNDLFAKLKPQTAKKFLIAVAENIVSPYRQVYCCPSETPELSFSLVTCARKELRVKGKYRLFWLNLLTSWPYPLMTPLVYDIVAMEVEEDVNQLIEIIDINKKVFEGSKLGKGGHNMTKYDRCVSALNELMQPNPIKTYKIFDFNAIEKDKDQGNAFYKENKFKEAIRIYSKVLNALEWYTIMELPDKSFDSNNLEAYNLMAVVRCNRANSYLGLKEPFKAIADTTVGVRHLKQLKVFNQLANDMLGWHSIDDSILEERKVKFKFRRARGLLDVSLPGPALYNLLQVMKQGKFRAFALPYYYKALVMFLQYEKTPQYPYICVICCDKSQHKTSYALLTAKCSNCKHPYCSKVCQDRDKKLHLEHCEALSTHYSEAKVHAKQRYAQWNSLIQHDKIIS